MPELSTGIDESSPWYYQLIKTVGPTAAIALFLVYFITIQMQPILQSMNGFMISHAAQMDALLKDERDDAEQRSKQWDLIRQIQDISHKDKEAALELEQQTCINTAKSPYQSQRCLEIRNEGEAYRN